MSGSWVYFPETVQDLLPFTEAGLEMFVADPEADDISIVPGGKIPGAGDQISDVQDA